MSKKLILSELKNVYFVQSTLDQRVTELRTERCEIADGPEPEASAEAPRDAPLPALLDWALHGLAAVGALT
ncbi:hypothetical protein ACFVL6_20480, partial [Bacillus subtilis]